MLKTDYYIEHRYKCGIQYEIINKSTRESEGFVDYVRNSKKEPKNLTNRLKKKLLEDKGLNADDYYLVPCNTIYKVERLDRLIYDKYVETSITYK